MENTGGEFYVQSKSETVSRIVEEIRSHEAMAVDDIITEIQIDTPLPYMIALLICIAGSSLVLLFLKGK